jgi:hypothetical protein
MAIRHHKEPEQSDAVRHTIDRWTLAHHTQHEAMQHWGDVVRLVSQL